MMRLLSELVRSRVDFLLHSKLYEEDVGMFAKMIDELINYEQQRQGIAHSLSG